MKADIKAKRAAFEPFNLVITVESRDELKELWHRFNVDTAVVVRQMGPDFPLNTTCDLSDIIWELLEEEANRRGLYDE